MEDNRTKSQRDIITYAEFLEATTGTVYTIDERKKINDEQTPDWFHLYQHRAMALFQKRVAQCHLLPRNRMDYLDLKEDVWQEYGTHLYHYEAYNFKFLFKQALAEQIRFMHDEEITIQNGYLNATNSVNVGGYSQSQTPMNIVNKVFSDIHPTAFDNFDTMGWMNACLNHRVDRNIYYKNEVGKYVIE